MEAAGATGAAGPPAPVGSFVALGDSFTEGLDDPGPAGHYLGWADRFAAHLADRRPGLRYANLAVRGKTLGEVVTEQLPVALALAPELVSIAAGGNDLLRPGGNPDLLAVVFEGAVASLREAGCRVIILTGFDPRTFPVIRWIRGKVAVYNMHLRGIADRYDCTVVDLWSMPVLCDPRVWSEDRLHLSAEGHRRVALRACEAVGAPLAADWREPLLPAAAGSPAWLAARRVDARWARVHAMPWVQRRIRGASSGDDVPPKRPDLLPLDGPAAYPVIAGP
ncbi:MAG TPA: SGNH/GDSL hydrolase family protein [Streptosporangiaceae bacterium]|jgi:lysophospholipase L1-like esterase